MKKFLRPTEYAKERSVCVRTVRTWMADRIIPYIKVSKATLIDPDKADRALEAFERGVQAK